MRTLAKPLGSGTQFPTAENAAPSADGLAAFPQQRAAEHPHLLSRTVNRKTASGNAGSAWARERPAKTGLRTDLCALGGRSSRIPGLVALMDTIVDRANL